MKELLMETGDIWYGMYCVVWIIAMLGFTGLRLWYRRPTTRRDQAGLSLSFKAFSMHVKLTPEEVKRRLTEAVEPFTFLRTSLEYKGGYEGQWLRADRFELHRLVL